MAPRSCGAINKYLDSVIREEWSRSWRLVSAATFVRRASPARAIPQRSAR